MSAVPFWIRDHSYPPPAATALCCAPAAPPLPVLLGSSAASLTLPAINSDDPSAATLYQRALERQVLYNDLDTEAARKGLLLGHEIVSTTTQSQVFDRVSKPGHWKKPTVKAILHSLEVGNGATQHEGCTQGWGCGQRGLRQPSARGSSSGYLQRQCCSSGVLQQWGLRHSLSQHARWAAHMQAGDRCGPVVCVPCCCCLLLFAVSCSIPSGLW